MSLRGGPMVCVGCDKEYTTSEFGELVIHSSKANGVEVTASEPKSQQIVKELAETISEEDEDYEEEESDEYDGFNFDDMPVLSMASFAVDKNDASYKISQGLLKGWAVGCDDG